MTENALERFVRKTRALFAVEADPEKRWAAMNPILAEMLADPAVVASSKSWPVSERTAKRGENLLFYEDPDYGFAVNGLIKSGVPHAGPRWVHDHGHIYTLYGVLDGEERIERYAEPDRQGGVPQRAVDRVVSAGEIDLVKPREIHSEVTTGDRTVALIIRSQRSGGFNQRRFNLDTGEYNEAPGPQQKPYRMF